MREVRPAMTIEASAAPRPQVRPAQPSGTPVSFAGQELDWVSQLPSAAAPGFVYLAGACRGVPVGGGGARSPRRPARLAGETAEVLAQDAAPVPDRCARRPGDRRALDRGRGAAAGRRRRRWRPGRPVGVPAAAIFRGGRAEAERAPRRRRRASGSRPGRTARRRGWRRCWSSSSATPRRAGGTRARGRASSTSRVAAAAAADLAALRRGAGWPRRTAFLELASATGLPVVCALSCDADGRGLAFGFKAAADPAAAARGALIELLQMEIGLELARLRAGPRQPGRGRPRTAGPGGAGAGRVRGLRRAAAGARAADGRGAGFAAVAAHLAARGLPVTVADLPRRPGGLAVAKVFAPGLRPLPGPGPVGRARRGRARR